MGKTISSSKNQKKPSKTNKKQIYNLNQKISVKKSPEKQPFKIKQETSIEKKVLENPKANFFVETRKKTLLSKKASTSTAETVDKSFLKKASTSKQIVSKHNEDKSQAKSETPAKKSSKKPKTSDQSSNTPPLKKATTPAVLKKEESLPERYTSTEKRIKTPISLEGLKYVRRFLENSLSEECVNFLYNLKLDFIYEDSYLKADYPPGLACKFLYILQGKGIAEYIKKERTEEKARFDFLWMIKSEEILRQARMFYADQLREIDEILNKMVLQDMYVDSVAGKYYTFDEAVERNFIGEGGVELKQCDSRELLIKKHKLEKIINSLTNVQLTSLKGDAVV